MMPRRFLTSALARLHPWLWPLAILAAASVPVAGAFSTTHVFHVRDLGLFFWPRHLWIRQNLLDGRLPLWDPYAAAGQSAAADALNHLFFPFALALRFLPPVIGFNLWIALPFPLAALGAYVLFAERVSRPAAALGALVFVASGPVVSSGNFPNFSWAVAAMPWIVWSAGRLAASPSRGRFTVAAALVGLQALAGEPVTLFATGAVTAAWLWYGDQRHALRTRIQRVAWCAAAGLLGMLLAAVQLVPLGVAAARSTRVGLQESGMWSLHPLALLEGVAPHLFGDTYEASFDRLQWVQPLNSDREPLLFSLYVGVAALTLALHALCAQPKRHRRWISFWAIAAVAALVLAFGTYTPAYSMLVSAVPVLQGLRFPVKYLLVAMLGVAALVAVSWDNLCAEASGAVTSARRPAAALLALVVAATAGAAALAPFIVPDLFAGAATALGRAVGVSDAGAAGEYMLRTAPAAGLRLSLMSGAVAALLWLAAAGRDESRLAVAVLFAVTVLDPLSVNARMHPTLPAAALGAPSWTGVLSRDARTYVGGRLTLPGTTRMMDAPPRGAVGADDSRSMIDAQTLAYTQYALWPAAWGLREVVSYDLPQLWPREYHNAMRLFAAADRDQRLRFLSNAGVRYCVVPEPPPGSGEPLAYVASLPGMAVYECGPTARRTFVVPDARVVADAQLRIAALLSADVDLSKTVLLESSPPAAGGGSHPGRPAADAARESSATIVSDGPERVMVRVVTGAGSGYVVLLDSYDPWWRVKIDGVDAPLLRANVLFRAVHLAPGEHLVEFVYRPVPLYAGAALTLLAVGGLILPWPRRLQRNVRSGPHPEGSAPRRTILKDLA